MSLDLAPVSALSCSRAGLKKAFATLNLLFPYCIFNVCFEGTLCFHWAAPRPTCNLRKGTRPTKVVEMLRHISCCCIWNVHLAVTLAGPSQRDNHLSRVNSTRALPDTRVTACKSPRLGYAEHALWDRLALHSNFNILCRHLLFKLLPEKGRRADWRSRSYFKSVFNALKQVEWNRFCRSDRVWTPNKMVYWSQRRSDLVKWQKQLLTFNKFWPMKSLVWVSSFQILTICQIWSPCSLRCCFCSYCLRYSINHEFNLYFYRTVSV